MSHVFWSDTAKTWEVFAALHNSLKHVQYMCILDDIGCICEKWRKLYLCVYVLRHVCIYHVSQPWKCQQKIHDFHLYFAPTLPYMPLPNSSNSVAWTCSSSTCLVRPLSGSSASASAPFSTTSEGASPVSCKRATFLLALYNKMTFTDLKKYTYLLPAISCGVLHTWTCTQRWRIAESR